MAAKYKQKIFTIKMACGLIFAHNKLLLHSMYECGQQQRVHIFVICTIFITIIHESISLDMNEWVENFKFSSFYNLVGVVLGFWEC